MDDTQLIILFCMIDEFCIKFEPEWKRIHMEHLSKSQRWWTTREPRLILSEMMTIVCYFHFSGYKTFKHYYLHHVEAHLKPYFPRLVSYKRFNKLMKGLIFPLFAFQQTVKGISKGIAYIDSTILSVCHICRTSRHKVFKSIAKKGKTSTGWFYGLKLHVVINHMGEIVSWMLTSGNTDDRTVVRKLVSGLSGKLFGDRGYVSKSLFGTLYKQGIQLITRLKSNMKNVLMDTCDKVLLYKRGIIESAFNKLKTTFQIEHHRHRSQQNFVVNLISGLTAYCLDPKKPKITMGLRAG